MADREKVILGIENCITTDSVTECRKTECPFIACRESCLEWLLRSALSLLKAQEPHVITMDDFSRCDDFGYIPAVFEPRDMPNFMNWEWSIINQNALSHNDGRYWSGIPSDEQREAVKWE